MAPRWFNHLKNFYLRDEEKDLPVVSQQTAAFLSILFTLSYVLPFYLSAQTRPAPNLHRDAPSIIRARIRTVTAACIASTLVTIYIIVNNGKATIFEALRLLGWWPIGASETVKCVLLTGILFSGPLFEAGVCEGRWRSWIAGKRLAETFGSWIGWRNFVAGPITEEVLFRSAIIPLHILAKLSPTRIVFASPLYFGIAHIHHFYEFKLTHPHVPTPPALIRSLFQFAYTTIFGWYAAFLYLRTGSLPAVILVHSFCNWCGLPRFWGRVEAGEPMGPPLDPKDKESSKESRIKVAGGRLSMIWTIAYYCILATGAAGFYLELWSLTESPRALVEFFAKKK
ncbi:MAG: hypothetical protein Q9227_002982 [Pyrenula ochraceoflavens]